MKRKIIVGFISVLSTLIIVALVFIDFSFIRKLYFVEFRKSGIIGHFNSNGKLDGEVDTYSDGVLLQKGYFKNGLADGWQLSYYKDGEIKCRESFKGGRFDGPKIVYYQNGQVKHRSFRKNDKVEGIEYEFYEDGNLEYQRNWINDKPYGDFYYYYPNKKPEVYHTYDILGDKFYLCRYDQAGKVSRDDGYVFSSHVYTKDHDSTEVLRNGNTYKSIKGLYVTVANPPQYTTNIRITINYKLREDLVFPNKNTVLISNIFNFRGSYHIVIEAAFDGKAGFTNYTSGELTVIVQ